jgi:galactose mutarotase-like enzyme
MRLSHGDVVVEVAPQRGALVTSLRVAERDVLFLDRATFEDPTKNVRGGIPILFPFAGRLAGDAFLPAGTQMKQHGFVRSRPWVVREERSDGVRLSFVPDAETRALYPYEYDLEFDVQLLRRGVQVELMIHNTGSRPLPAAPGWHPYFRSPAARKADIASDSVALAGRPTDEREFDFGLEAPATGRTRFEIPALGNLRVAFSPAMRHLQFWSQPARDFVCIEPFYGPENTVNTDARLDVAPGRAVDLWMRIELA